MGTGYQLLQYIDKYGNTMFNRLQIDAFLDEWLRLADEGKGSMTFFREVEALALSCKEEPHLYVWFIGD